MSDTLIEAHWTVGAGQSPVIVATAAINGLAFHPHQIWALSRAEQCAFSQSPFFCGNGKPATMAHVTTMPPTMLGVERLEILARAAIEQLMPEPQRYARARRAALFLALPGRMGDPQLAVGDSLRDRERLLRGVTDVVHSMPFACSVVPCVQGHAAGAFALREAGRALSQGAIELALVVGVDTYYDSAVVQALIDAGRIFDGDNPDAFIGGEGAAACLLTTASIAGSLGWSTLAAIEAAATAIEPSRPDNDVPNDAVAMTRATRSALAPLVRERRMLDVWMNDLTGEELRAHELMLAGPRVSHGSMGPRTSVQHLPETCGDLGAATLPTAWALACELFQRDPAVESCLATAAHLAGGERGAVVLRSAGRR